MKSLFQSNISWLMFLYIFTGLLTYAMEENKTGVDHNYTVNKLQHNFTKLMKNPQKYVEFYLNTDDTLKNSDYADSNAGGLYKLLPYYQKINILDEKENYAIKWCQYKKKYQLVKVNPFGDPPFNAKQTNIPTSFDAEPIATFLQGDQFSRLTNADIKAYTTYEQMKLVVKMLSEENKQLKIHIGEKKTKFNAYDLEKKEIIDNANKLIETKTEENERLVEEVEKLKSNLKEKEKENKDLEKQKGGLEYKLSQEKEFEKKFLILEKETKPLKDIIKKYDTKFKKLETTLNKFEVNASELEKQLKKQIDQNTVLQFDRSSFKNYELKNAKETRKMAQEIETQRSDMKINDNRSKNIISKKDEQIEILKEKLTNLENVEMKIFLEEKNAEMIKVKEDALQLALKQNIRIEVLEENLTNLQKQIEKLKK